MNVRINFSIVFLLLSLLCVGQSTDLDRTQNEEYIPELNQDKLLGDIIIIEKKVYRPVGANGNLCDCSLNEEIYQVSNFAGMSSVTIANWTPSINRRYVLQIDYKNESYSSYLSYTPVSTTDPESEIVFSVDCLGNMNDGPVQNNTLSSYGEIAPLGIHLNPTNYNWELTHGNLIMKSVTLKLCSPNEETALGVNNNDLSSNVIISPNPSRNFINLELRDSQKSAIEKIAVYDQSGTLRFSEQHSSRNSTLDISNLSAGIYWVKISTKEKNYVERFFKIE